MYLDKPREECGVVGIWNHPHAAALTGNALIAMQHRGEEAAGVATTSGGRVYLLKGQGLVANVLERKETDSLKGDAAIGHNRYSLSGDRDATNVQPFAMDKGYNPDQTSAGEQIDYGPIFIQAYQHSPFAIAHNGQINRGLEEMLYEGRSDSKALAAMISKLQKNTRQNIIDALRRVKGSYALVILTPDMLVGARDPEGYRPLSLGSIDNALLLASETCAFNQIGAHFIRDINPGEVLFIGKKGLHSDYVYAGSPPPRRECIFEHIYLARQDSVVFGESVYEIRLKLGQILAKECPVNADLALGVPDAGNVYAKGFAKELGIDHASEGLDRSHYVGRVFIQPGHESRLAGADLKFFPIPQVIRGKRIVLIDDSIVRGVNIAACVKKLRACGAKEIHVRIASPPYISACNWGVDTYETSKLIALNRNMGEIITQLKVDSLQYLSLEGMLSAFNNPEYKCMHCFERH